MKLQIALLLVCTLSSTLAQAAVPWSQQAHENLIRQAFPNEREDCIARMNAGSEWVDSLPNQIPSKSYLHAMRSGTDESVADARDKMADFIQSEHDAAIDLFHASTEVINESPNDPGANLTSDGRLITDLNEYLAYCEHRGRGLHPLMDSTSPAHAGFAIWSISDLGEIMKHGNMPESIENERALFANPDIMQKTIALMHLVQILYVDLGMGDYRFE